MTVAVMVAKMPFRTRLYNANQKVWLLFATGAEACHVMGKYRGSGRYVKGWVNWRSRDRSAPSFQLIDVPQEFADRHGLWRSL
jgi:hypothetical protein